MTTLSFRKAFDANLQEIFWLEETSLTSNLADEREFAEKRIKDLQQQNRELDTNYLTSLALDEPFKYNLLQSNGVAL